MPIPVKSGAEARRLHKPRPVVRRKPKPYTPPAGRSDAAQRLGSRPAPRRSSPNPVVYHAPAPSRSDAAQRKGKTPVKPLGRQKALRANRKAAKQKILIARHRFAPKDPVQSLVRSERKAISNLADLRASDPVRYARKEQEASDTKILGKVNIEKPARKANEAVLKASEWAKRRVDKSGGNYGRVQRTAGIDSGAAGKEILDLAANAPSGAYMTAAAAHELSQGRPSRAKKLWKEYKDTSAIPAALSGNWKEAAKRAQAHPIATGLELSGAKAVVGRTAGAVARKAPSKRIRQAASTERENLRLYPDAKPGEGPEIQRRYSKDVINKAAQKAGERYQRRKGRDPNVDRGTYMAPAMPRKLGGSGKPGAPNRPKLVRRIDTRVFSQDRIASHRKAEAEKQAIKLTKKKRAGSAAGVQAVAEGTARSTSPKRIRADLNKRLGQLAKARKEITDPERLRLNREEAKHWREVKALPDDKLVQVVEASGALAKQQAGVQARGIRAGAWTHVGQSKRWLPYLQSHTRRPGGEEKVKGVGYREMGPAPETLSRAGRNEGTAAKRAATQTEQQAAARAIQRRLKQGKEVGPRLQKHVEEILGRIPQQTKLTNGSWRPVPFRGGIGAAIAKLSERSEAPPIKGAAVPERRKIEMRGPEPGGPRGRGQFVRQAEVYPYLNEVRRRVNVKGRKLNEEELANAARTAERISRRRGESPVRGTTEGGPALITQRPGRTRTAARLQASAPFEPMKARGGRAFEEGSRPTGREAIVRQAVGAEAEVTAAEGFQLLDREFGVAAAKTGKRYAATRDEALREANRRTLDPDTGELRENAIPLVPVNIAQFQTFGGRLLAKQEQGMPRSYASINDMERGVLEDTWRAATEESGRGKWVLMPEPVVQRLREHASVGNFGPMHSLTNIFKDVVLTTSSPSRWIGGNVADLTMRTVMAGITPADIARGRMIVRGAARKGTQGEHAAAAVSGGGLYHASEALTQSARPRGLAESPGRTVLAAPWRAWKGAVYAIEHSLEELPQWGAVGKSMRQETGRSWAKADGEMKRDLKSMLKLHDAQLDNYANKLATDRAFEARIQKTTEDVIGRWGKVSPNMRRALLVAPFAQWLGAATRYTFVTLPGKHPIKTGIIAGISEMTEDERKKLGLSYFLPRNEQVADYQMGSLPLSVGKNKYGPVVKGLRTARMTSLGTAAGLPGNIGEFLFPQFAGALDAWAGQSFTGEQLVYPDWWPDEKLRRLPLPPDERTKIGLGALLESSIPFASMFRRSVLEGGAPAEPYSTILTPATRKRFDKENKQYVENKGTALGGILEWLSPVPAAVEPGTAKPTLKQRLYTYGAGKAIEEQGITGETLERWRKQPKQSKGFGFGGGSTKTPTEDFGFGNRGLTEKEKKKAYGF